MDFLHRIFYGRVAKHRSASTDQHLDGNTSKAASRSPAQPRRMRNPILRVDQGITASSLAGFDSLQHSQPSQIGTGLIHETRITQEHDEPTFTMAPARGDHFGLSPNNGHPDEYMATVDGLEENASREHPVKEDPSEGGSFKEGSEHANEEQSDKDDAIDESNATGPYFLSSDEPVPSIEQDSDAELFRPRKKIPPFLHGKTRRRDRASGSVPGDGIDEGFGMEDEDFGEELGGEIEENLLIDNDDLRYWLHHKRSTARIENWPSVACRLYKLLFLRGLYPMFASQWTWNFLDHPMPGELFTPLGSDDKCLLKAEKSDYHGMSNPPAYLWPMANMKAASKALIRLFNLHGYINDFRQCGIHQKIAPLIEKEIKRYVLWAEKDGDFVKKHDYVSPVFVITYKDAQAASTGRPIVEKCQALVLKYRSQYAARGIQDYPRCIYIFVVVQHIVLVMVADTEHPDEEEPYPLAELDLSQRSHWLDYSLGIAITVMLARESLLAHRWALPEIEVVEDDPDI